MSKKLIVFALFMFALVIVSGGYGGGSSGSVPMGDNPQGVALEDVRKDGAKVDLGIRWDKIRYNLELRNIGNGGEIGDFEAIDLPDDLPFTVIMGYGAEGVSALITDKEYDDLRLLFVVNVKKATHYEEYSGVLSQIWERTDYIESFAVNGVEMLEDLEYDMEYEPVRVERFTLADVMVDKGVFTVNFTKGSKFYHYTWRNRADNWDFFSIDNQYANELSMFVMSYCRNGFETIFVDDNTGEWIIMVFNPENSTYRIESNSDDIGGVEVLVNGEDVTEKLTLEPPHVSSGLASALTKGSIVSMKVRLQGKLRAYDFVNIGAGEFVCVNDAANATLSMTGSMMIANLEEGEEDSRDMVVMLYLNEDSYRTVASDGDQLVSVSVNGKDISDMLTNEDEIQE